ncbi:MAG: hypothetical protein ACRDYX_14180 [Egibacteraceae bacterium]
MTAQEVLDQVKKLIDATLAEVAPDAKLTPDAVPGGTPCESSLSGHTGQLSYSYGFSFPVADEATGERVVRETARFWTTRGYAVDDFSQDQVAPSVHTGNDGFDFMFTFARRTLSASIIGSTPCVDPLPGDV